MKARTIKKYEKLFKSVILGIQFDYKENNQKRNDCGKLVIPKL